MSDKYILNEYGEPTPCNDLLAWGRWMQAAERHVAKDQISDDVSVSTVFLGLDHSFGGGVPILYETMIFGGPHDQYQDRYATKEEALAGHAVAVELAKSPLAVQS